MLGPDEVGVVLESDIKLGDDALGLVLESGMFGFELGSFGLELDEFEIVFSVHFF